MFSWPIRPGLYGLSHRRELRRTLAKQYETARLQGFEAIGCLPRLLATPKVYQEVLRQSIKLDLYRTRYGPLLLTKAETI